MIGIQDMSNADMAIFALGAFVCLSLTAIHSLAVPAPSIPQSPQRIFLSPATHRPLVIWHGLGDTANGEGIAGLMEDIKDMYPGIYIHSVQYPVSGSIDDERKAGFYGNASMQVDAVAETIRGIPELAEGFDTIGFSQGGLFMRDYVQRYNQPRVRNLLTVSSGVLSVYGLTKLDPVSLAVLIWESLDSSHAARRSTSCASSPSRRHKRESTPNGRRTT